MAALNEVVVGVRFSARAVKALANQGATHGLTVAEMIRGSFHPLPDGTLFAELPTPATIAVRGVHGINGSLASYIRGEVDAETPPPRDGGPFDTAPLVVDHTDLERDGVTGLPTGRLAAKRRRIHRKAGRNERRGTGNAWRSKFDAGLQARADDGEAAG